MTRRWLASHPRFLVDYLPAYSGHETNLVEKVCWESCAANRICPSLEALQHAIHGFFARFDAERAPQLTARQSTETDVNSGAFALTA